ncbi:type VI secretion protein [Streptomyces uncialis]|uniref:type IV secretory system conjugative DNA transfer family protein n=1 Tax=Streptomyces uncialis TaxID=1048205 RepID=UPI002E2F4B25|nr:type VI secretion protein [Streptomyces uncialis]
MPGQDRGGYTAEYDSDPPRGGGGGPRRNERGVPDSLLVGGLAFLLGTTLLVWSSTSLAARFAHGSWPGGVTFDHTPAALRHLITNPGDLTGAWSATPADHLSGPGLFWTLFLTQLTLLIVLGVYVTRLATFLTTGRTRAQRAQDRARARKADHPYPRHAENRYDTPEDRGRYGDDRYGDPGRDGALHHADERPVDERPERKQLHPNRYEAPAATPQEAPLTPSTTHPSPSTAPALPAPSVTATPAHPGPAAPAPATPTATAAGTAPAQAAAPLPVPHPVPPSPSPLFLGPPDARQPLAVQAVRDAEGPALVITSDPAIWAETKDARAKLGPVLLYDPLHLCDTPARLHWSPSRGCEDRDTAALRAKALLAPIRPSAKLDTAVADTAETLLCCFLHAAAVDGRQFRHVHRWAQGSQVQEAVRALRTNPAAASGSAGELEAALTAYPERRDIAQELTARALSALFTVNVREACTPNRTDALTLDSFVAEGGTLYLVGEAIEDPKSRPGAMPLLTALASSVVEHGRRMAERSSSGRLDPPFALVLDDVAAVAPIPQLPALLASGADRGMPTLALLRSREQARARWPHDELPIPA